MNKSEFRVSRNNCNLQANGPNVMKFGHISCEDPPYLKIVLVRQ